MDQLKLLMDYTKFHIGFYLTFGSIGITLVKMGRLEYIEAIPGIILMLIAGAAGGVIASNIPEHKDWESFTKAKIKLFGKKYRIYGCFSKIEHFAFWLAIIITSTLILLDLN